MASKAIIHQTANLKPILSFGIITDIHYVNNDDRWNYSKTCLRRYRNSLKLVDEACDYWLNCSYPISFILQLGDLIDGLCEINKTTNEDLQTILKRFEKFPRIYHLWGNHELYNFHRNELINGPLCSFNIEQISPAHYGTIEVCSNLKILALDTYELSLLGIKKDTDAYQQALKEFRKYNSNEKVNDWTGLEGFNKRFTQLNGGLTQKQLDWLKEQLNTARIQRKNVLIIGHIPIHPQVGDELALLWNYKDVLNILSMYNDIVLAYIAGHCHDGGYIYDENQIHHLTLQAIVECESNINAFATVHVYNDYLLIEGQGKIDNYQIETKKNF